MARRIPHPLDGARDAALSLIQKIADRAVNIYAQSEIRVERQTVLLDVTACHFGPQKLRLDEMLAADEFHFMHDVVGINKHLDRANAKLCDGFTPRFSVR